jgi:hypothetical protein
MEIILGTHRLGQHGNNGFLHVEAIFSLIKNNAARIIEHGLLDFLPGVGR